MNATEQTPDQVLPSEVRLTPPPTMPQARSYLFKQKSTQATYSPQQVVQINIPRLQRSYLSKGSYLRFRVAFTGNLGACKSLAFAADTPAATYYFNNLKVCPDTMGAYSFIDKVEVYDYLGSTLLESTAGHGQLMGLLMDTSYSGDQCDAYFNSCAGIGKRVVALDQKMTRYGEQGAFGPAGVVTSAANPVASYPYALGTTNVLMGPLSGEPFDALTLPNATTGVSAEQTMYMEYSIPLLSFLGSLSDRYAPLHNGYTINITLNSIANAIGTTVVAPEGSVAFQSAPVFNSLSAITISNVHMACDVLELGPVAESMLLSSLKGKPLILPTKALRNYTSFISKQTSAFRLDLNLNVSSLCAVYWIMRPYTNLNNLAKRSLSARIRNFLKSWYFQYGSSVLPQTAGIEAFGDQSMSAHARYGATECYMELMKSIGGTGSLITHGNYNMDQENNLASLSPDPLAVKFSGVDYVQVNEFDVPRFACGLNLELVDRPDEIVSGLNTNGMLTSINATFENSRLAEQVDVAVDAWCKYDAFINITPGLATTVSF